MSETIQRGGRRYVRFETVTVWYGVKREVLEEMVELQLVESESDASSGRLLPEEELDRLADLLRCHWQTGLSLESLALWPTWFRQR